MSRANRTPAQLLLPPPTPQPNNTLDISLPILILVEIDNIGVSPFRIVRCEPVSFQFFSLQNGFLCNGHRQYCFQLAVLYSRISQA